ncbi:hypothetical protein B0T14DRAFT_436365 [Immersiella caudata]|uniref:Uncharacterized protein n=1 Tax=Immersiella caudata TaxID=314043 RepID=A0AA39T2Q6_9PEZI|nr:hypothetical protein B0T14DRAFT_436365 [Immersiella caudata]
MGSTSELIRPSKPRQGSSSKPLAAKRTARAVSFLQHITSLRFSLNTILQCAFLVIHISIFILILYYETTVYRNPNGSPFEAFMGSQTVGARLMFTVFGSALAFFWEHMFATISTDDMYRRLSLPSSPSNVSSTQLLTLHAPSTNVFEGFWFSLRHRNFRVGAVALSGIITKFAPVLLSNIPFQMSKTWISHEICTWLSVVVLGYGAIVLLVQMFLFNACREARNTKAHLPVDPRTLAGRMYYVGDSRMLRDFERLSMLGQKHRDERVAKMGRGYRYGLIRGS